MDREGSAAGSRPALHSLRWTGPLSHHRSGRVPERCGSRDNGFASSVPPYPATSRKRLILAPTGCPLRARASTVCCHLLHFIDRKSVGSGEGESVRVDLGCHRIIKKKKPN